MTRCVSRSANFSVLGLRAAALIAAVVSGTGCAESIGDIDRTQPDLIAKENFQGQWFIRESVVDVPPTSPASFVGENGSIETVVWDIQQNYLVGYRAYQEVPGLDGTAQSQLSQPSAQPVTTGQGQGRDPNVYKGNPVVAYHIDQHVDVQRGYNPRTGEQNNIISENSSDRPWYERAFMRVDWSRNDVNNFLTTPQPFWPIFGESSTVTDYIPANEGGPDAFHVETDDSGLANYIDFTVRETLQPNIFGCSAMMNSELGDCTGEEIKMRTSLMKVDPAAEQEYVPLVYDDRREGEFGYFRVERPTYDRRLGETFTGLIQLAGRHDVWSKSRDASGTPLDYAARTLKPIKYALSENFPDSLRKVADQIGKDYDTATKTVIAATRKQSVADLEQDLLNDTGDTCMFCIDTNEDNHARNGDLRYNFMYWVDDLQAAGPLGFGPSSLNPETGRIVSASAYVYGAGVDRYAEQAKEIVELLIGKDQGGLSDDDLVSGDYIRNAVRANLTPIDPRKLGVNLAGLSGEALSRKILGEKGFARAQALALNGGKDIPTAIPGLDASRLQRVVGTPLEALMVPDEWTRAAQAGQTSYLQQRSALLAKQAQALGEPAPAEGPLGYLSVTNWFGPDALNFQKQLEDKASQHSLWLANFDDPAIAGLAHDVANMGLAGDDLFQYLRGRIFRSVMLHELGHTLGLRHNFAGSADALNYQDDYWPLRQESIDPVAAYTQGTTSSPDALLRSNCSIQGPLQAASDGSAIAGTDVTQACQDQENGKMGELQYSSIMDYGSRFNSDIHGLGHYDIAALGAGYGDLVEVFDDTAVAGIAKGTSATGVDTRSAIAFANTVRNPILEQGIDNALAQTDPKGLQYGHYQDYPALFGGYQNIAKRKFIPRTDYLNSLNAAQGNPAQAPVKVPYLSCYDEYVDSVDVCHRWDSGADNYEIVSNYVNLYEQYYVFNNFQRDRVGFDPFMVAQRTASRYFLPLTNMYQHWLWGAFITGLAPQGSPRGDLGLVATRQALNLLQNTMSTPEYGPHTYDPTVGEYVPSTGACPDVSSPVLVPTDGVQAGSTPTLMSMPKCVDIPRGVGRSYFSRYDSSGYDVFRRVLESGHFYDQLAALQALQQSNASVVGIGQDVQADSRTFRLPWNLLFPDEVGGLFSAIYRQDDTAYAQHINGPAGTTDPSVVNLSVFTDPNTMAALPIVQPGRTYTTRVQALVAGMNLLDGTLNASFAKQGQISLGGSGEERTAPAGFTAVTATDPASGRIFVAYRKTDGTDGPWYAADLLDGANKLINSGTATAGDITTAFGDIELVRLAFGIFGQ